MRPLPFSILFDNDDVTNELPKIATEKWLGTYFCRCQEVKNYENDYRLTF